MSEHLPSALPLIERYDAFLLDLWGVFLNVAFGVPLSDYATVGRWLGYMPAGRFVHASIRAAPPVQGERIIGWIAHYATGIVFAALLVVICGEDWLRHPSLVPALLLGIITVAAPFLLMQPGMGLGIASSRAPNPSAARLRSLATHAAFGVGLFVAAWILARLTR